MIPYKLRLQNFLSYRDDVPPLDFTGMHLVCLVGGNGHGKSALLDGITWALWGRARTTSDDELMHVGCDEMQVEFEFVLNGQRYNVVRKRLKRGRSRRSELELAVWDEASGGWQALSEPSIRATQARINRILRMDYETFVNSAFLKQGEADAFTSKSPAERKDILASILNLSQYDAYAEKAKELAKEAESEVQFLKARLDEIDEELARRPQYEEALQAATLAESQANARRLEADKAVAELRLAVRDLAAKQASLKELEQRIEEEVRALEETRRAISATQADLQAVRELLAQREDIAEMYRRLQAAQDEERRWADVLEARRPLEEEQRRLEQALREARAQIERELAVARKTLADLQKRMTAIPHLQSRAADLQKAMAELEALEQAHNERRERVVALKAEQERLAQEKARLEEEGRSLRERREILLEGEASTCPVCRQPLGEEGRRHLQAEYDGRLSELREAFKRIREEEKALAKEEQALKQALKRDELELKRLGSLRREQAQVEAQIAETERAQTELQAAQAQVAALEDRMRGEYAPEIQAALAEVSARLDALPYDAAAHRQARETVAKLREVERRQAEVEQAAKREAALVETLAAQQAREAREAERLQSDRERRQELIAEVAELASLQEALERQRAVADDALAEWESAHAQLVAAQQKLQACAELAETRKQQARLLQQTREKAARYRHLREAFGPRGVQALIIESALPELETEANRLLARLSDGRMNVRLETQRELKSGGTRETLDIIISDELGSRPYELYSGGEAFRADLALRVALSRLLARRAGAALQTLFIDEGFGTQDAQGRENLIEAIHMIKDEFALVLVITHIDELKEQFPVRIEVVKEDGAGSRYTVV